MKEASEKYGGFFCFFWQARKDEKSVFVDP